MRNGVQSVSHQSTNSLYLCCLLNALLFFLTMFLTSNVIALVCFCRFRNLNLAISCFLHNHPKFHFQRWLGKSEQGG